MLTNRIYYAFKFIAFGFLISSMFGCRFVLTDGSLEIGELSAETKIKE